MNPAVEEINYPFLFDCIDRAGFDGWICCEYTPVATTRDGVVG
jgi:hydroxypyruvate isomerase